LSRRRIALQRQVRPSGRDQHARAGMTLPTSKRSDADYARLLLIALCIGWGTSWVTMRMALEEIPPFSMRVATLALGVALLTAFAKYQGRSLVISSRRTWLHVCVASFFNIVAFSVFTPFAQLAAETSRVAIMVYTMPIWAAMIALFVLGERMTRTRTLALSLCVAGMAVLIAPLMGQRTLYGLLLALGASIGWAAGTVYIKWARLEGEPMALTIWQLVFGLVVIAVCLPVFEGGLHLNAGAWSMFGLIYSGIVASGLCYFLWFTIVRILPASEASLGVLASPVVGVVTAMIVLGERPTLYDGIGFALMLSASAIVVLRPDGAARPEQRD
jgi:drug/metabolite transporter (DMT)-like permease